jgi:hypothetical protein
MTHGGDGANQTWRTNTGIRLLRLRKDGFVSVDAPYTFPSSRAALPSFTTVPVRVPGDCPPPQQTNSTVEVSIVCY